MTQCMQANETSTTPPRVHHAEAARVRFGARFDILVAALARSDLAADRAIDSLQNRSDADACINRAIAGQVDGQLPEALVEMVAGATEVPAWLDRSRIARACQLFHRAGPLGGLVLALRSLIGGYIAPVGNKPLAFSGRLREQAPRRLAETSRFVTAITSEGGLLPGGEGLAITLRVRLMHARIRRLLQADERWDHERWGLPINQHDMLATILLFSAVFIDGLKLMGVPVSDADAEDYLHLWRYVGVVIGVEPSLLPTSFAAARRDVDLIQLTSGEPDEDSRALAQALFEIPASLTPLERGLASARVTLMQALCRRLLGDAVADSLGIEATSIDRILPLTSPMIRGSHLLRRLSPRLDDLALRLSAAYWDYSASAGLGGDPPTYPLPEGLRSRPHLGG